MRLFAVTGIEDAKRMLPLKAQSSLGPFQECYSEHQTWGVGTYWVSLSTEPPTSTYILRRAPQCQQHSLTSPHQQEVCLNRRRPCCRRWGASVSGRIAPQSRGGEGRRGAGRGWWRRARWDPVGEAVGSDGDVPWKGPVCRRSHLWSLALRGSEDVQIFQGSSVDRDHFLYDPGASSCLWDGKVANGAAATAAAAADTLGA